MVEKTVVKEELLISLSDILVLTPNELTVDLDTATIETFCQKGDTYVEIKEITICMPEKGECPIGHYDGDLESMPSYSCDLLYRLHRILYEEYEKHHKTNQHENPLKFISGRIIGLIEKTKNSATNYKYDL